MARRAPPTYDAMTLKSDVIPTPIADVTPTIRSQPSAVGPPQALKEVSAQLMLYIHPDAAKSLQRYALEQSAPGKKVKVHDLLIEAVEEWFRRHGLRETVRAKEPRRKARLAPPQSS